MTCYNLKFNTKPDVGSTFHPFIIHYLILVARSQFDSVMGLFIIWKTFCSYQVEKKQNKTTKQKRKQTNENDVNV